MRRFFSSLIAFSLGLCALSAQGSNKNEDLEAKLKAAYPPSKTAMMDPGKVTELGAVLSIRQTGIGSACGSAMIQRAHVRDGVIKSEGSHSDSYPLPVGTKIYLRTLSLSDENIDFHIYTLDPVERIVHGTTKSEHCTAMVRFEFAKGYLATATLADVQKAIGTVLATDAQAAASKTIEMGQTFEQVEAVMGKPENTVKLGPKTIYTYKAMKVVFMDGKVSDVQ